MSSVPGMVAPARSPMNRHVRASPVRSVTRLVRTTRAPSYRAADIAHQKIALMRSLHPRAQLAELEHVRRARGSEYDLDAPISRHVTRSRRGWGRDDESPLRVEHGPQPLRDDLLVARHESTWSARCRCRRPCRRGGQTPRQSRCAVPRSKEIGGLLPCQPALRGSPPQRDARRRQR
jgi:hypothetical protein